MGSETLQPQPRKPGFVRYVDDREFTRLVLSRRKLERVGTLGQTGPRIRDVGTGELYELEADPEDTGSRSAAVFA